MNSPIYKTQENESQPVRDTVSKKQKSGTALTFQLIDNRPEVVTQRKLQTMANESSQVSQMRTIQKVAQQRTLQPKVPIQKKTNKTGLPDHLKTGIENLSGYSMDDVKVHYNSNKPAQLQAHAYAQGTNIHIASGQEKHLPHEAWHVVQQKQGRVQPTMQMKGNVNVNDNVGLEKEADVMGNEASNSTNTETKKIQFKSDKRFCNQTPIKSIVQCAFQEKKFNNTIATRSILSAHRKTEGLWNRTGCQKNFAIDMDNTGTYGFSDEGGHSERNLLGHMFIGGRAAGTDINIHTERETCISCYNYLKNLHDSQVGTPGAFNMNISYTVKYPGSGKSKEELHKYYKKNSDMK